MLRRATLLILAFVLVSTSPLLAQKTLPATQAKAHIGEQATVCGKVVSTRWAESSHRSPTFPEPRSAVSRSGVHACYLGN